MSALKRNTRLGCVSYLNGIRMYVTDQHGLKKSIGGDDSLFMDAPFSEENVREACKLIAKVNGLQAQFVGEGRASSNGISYIYDLV